MTILSPSEDFWCRSLADFPGPVSKLEYIVSLRTESGAYAHWGLTRVHGEAAANQAIANAHTKIFLEILRTPLSQLQRELRSLAQEQGAHARDLLDAFLERGERLVPHSLNGGSRRHFNSIWESLSAIERAPAPVTGRAA